MSEWPGNHPAIRGTHPTANTSTEYKSIQNRVMFTLFWPSGRRFPVTCYQRSKVLIDITVYGSSQMTSESGIRTDGSSAQDQATPKEYKIIARATRPVAAAKRAGQVSWGERWRSLHQDDVNSRHMLGSLAAALCALLIFLPGEDVNGWFVTHHVAIPIDRGATIAILLWVALVTYLILMLVSITNKGREAQPERPLCLPSRGSAIAVLSMWLWCSVVASAAFNMSQGFIAGGRATDYLLDAFITTATFDHGHYVQSDASLPARLGVAVEVATALLLLIVFIPLVVSRLGLFQGDTVAPEKPVEITLTFVAGEPTAATWNGTTASCALQQCPNAKAVKISVYSSGEFVMEKATPG